jgi:hypothetical protein
MTVGLLSFGAPSSAFSGGRSQFNPNTYGESMFLDMFKQGQGWGYIDPTASGYDLDSDGWPRAIPGGVATTNLIRIPETYEREWTSGCYKVTWKDAGTVRLTSLTVVTNGPGVTSGIVSGQYEAVSTTTGDFYVLVTPTSSSPQIGIKAIGSGSYVRDMHFYYTSDEAEFLAGKILSARARQVISDLGFGVMRHMNWGANTGANYSSVTTWDTRRRRSNAFWLYPTDYRSDFYVGETTSVVNGSVYTYTIDTGGAPPTPMQTIHVKWDRTLVSPELGNVAELEFNGQTNRILNFRAQVPGVGQNGNSSGVPYLGSIYTLVYDAVLEAWLAFGASGSVTTNFIDNGIPPDVFIDICKEIGCHPWICPGYLSTAPEIMLDTAVSWPYNFDQLIQSNGPSWMEAFWEGCNEPWNNQFYWQKWAPARQLVYMGGRKPQDAVPTPYLGTAVTSAVAGAVEISMTGPLPAKGALVMINSESAPGLLQFDGTSGYVTASGAGSITLDSATIAGSFAGSSGASTITLANPGTITVPVSVTANQALKLTTTGTLPASIPADGVVYAKTTGTTVQISATNGGAALDLSADSQSGTHTVTVVIAMTLSEVAEPDYYGQIQSYLGQLIAQSRGVVKANVKTQTAYKMIIGIATRNFDFVSSTVNENVRATARSFVLTDAPIGSYVADPASEWTTAVAMANYLGVPTQLSATVANSTQLVTDFAGVEFTAGISGGVMTVASTTTGTVATGKTIFGPPGLQMADGVTITGDLGGGQWSISDNAISYPTGTKIYAGDLSADPNPLEIALDSALGCTFEGQTAGTVLTVNTPPVGSAIYSGMLIRDGLVGINRQVTITTFGTGTGGTGTYNLSTSALGTLSARAMSAQGPFSPSEIVNKATLLKAWAISFDIDNAYCYEGNLTADPGTAAYNLFHYALRLCASSPAHAEGVKTMVKQNYDDLVALSGGGFTFAWPSCFQLDGRYPSNNNYSMMQSIYNDYPPQALAIQAFNA